MVEPELDRIWRLAALLHDAPEYVIGDMISPFKAALGLDYRAFEDRLLRAIHVRFSLPPEVPEPIARIVKGPTRRRPFSRRRSLPASAMMRRSGSSAGRPISGAGKPVTLTSLRPMPAERGRPALSGALSGAGVGVAANDHRLSAQRRVGPGREPQGEPCGEPARPGNDAADAAAGDRMPPPADASRHLRATRGLYPSRAVACRGNPQFRRGMGPIRSFALSLLCRNQPIDRCRLHRHVRAGASGRRDGACLGARGTLGGGEPQPADGGDCRHAAGARWPNGRCGDGDRPGRRCLRGRGVLLADSSQ